MSREYFDNNKKAYTKILQVVNAQRVAEQVKESILEHASVTVAKLGVSEFIASCPAKIHADLAKQRSFPGMLFPSPRLQHDAETS